MYRQFCTVIALHDIERLCRPPAGGLKEIALVEPDDLVAEPTYSRVPVATSAYKPGKRAWLFEANYFTGRLTDTQATSAQAGDYFDYELTATVRGVRLDVEYLREKLKNRRVHALVTYSDGTRRWLPFMRITSSSDSGRRLSERNEYSFVARLRRSSVAPFLEGTLSNGQLLLDQFGNLILIAPDDTRWRVTCDAAGVLLTVQVSTTDGVNFYPVSGQNLGVDTDGNLLTF